MKHTINYMFQLLLYLKLRLHSRLITDDCLSKNALIAGVLP